MGASRILEKKREALREIASDFAAGKLEEKAYEEKTSVLFAEIAELKSSAEQEEKLKKEYEATYAPVLGFPVFLEDRVVGKISGITASGGKPAFILAGSTCPSCKTLLEENAKFCVECGAAL